MPIGYFAVVDTTCSSSSALQVHITATSVPVDVKVVVHNLSTIGIIPPPKATVNVV